MVIEVEGKEKVYLAGPMEGIVEFNYPLFNALTNELRRQGHSVVNPAELDAEHGWPEEPGSDDYYVGPTARALYMRRDLPELVKCDAIALMPGWQDSVGANIELMTALVCGLTVWEWVEDERYGLVLVTADEARPDLYGIIGHIEGV